MPQTIFAPREVLTMLKRLLVPAFVVAFGGFMAVGCTDNSGNGNYNPNARGGAGTGGSAGGSGGAAGGSDGGAGAGGSGGTETDGGGGDQIPDADLDGALGG
jgi:hypothetical protein